MKYYVWWRTDPSCSSQEVVSESRDEAVAFINAARLKYPESTFEVFHGRRLRLEPREVVVSFRLED